VLGPRAEVGFVQVDGAVISIEGTLVPPDAAVNTLVARRDLDGHVVRSELPSRDGGFSATLDAGRLTALGDEPETWELLLAGEGPDLPLARLDDDVPNAAQAYVFPAARPAGRELRPRYDDARRLGIRSSRPKDPAAASKAPRPSGRSRAAHSAARPLRAVGAAALLVARAVAKRRRRRAGPGEERIVFVIANAWGMGGTIRTTLANAGQLAQTHRVEVISCFRHSDVPFFPFPDGVTVTVLDDLRRSSRLRRVPGFLTPHPDSRLARNWSLRTDLRFLRHAARLRAGIVIGTRPGINLLLARLARPGLTVIAQEHMNLDAHGALLRDALLARYPLVDELVVLTHGDGDAYRRALGSRPPVSVIPNAAGTTANAPPELERPVVVAAGRLTRQKGFDLLIEAFALVVERHPDWTLRIFGEGPWRGKLRRLIVADGLSNHVTLPGRVRDLSRQLSAASIFALSSRHEGLPMVLLEVMSEGLPVVSFDCPTGPGEVIADGSSGLLVPPEDPGALAAALCALIEHPDRRHALAAGGLARVDSAYSSEVVNAQWEALIARHSARR
jgi:glycosyltransferase involved in cell wall biosynthesis